MKEKKLYVCPRCHEWYSCDAKRSPEPCPNCHISPLPVQVDYSYWQTLTQQDKDDYKRKYMYEHQHEMQTASKKKKTAQTPRASITIVQMMGMLVILSCVGAGIYLGGMPGCLIGLVVGSVSSAGLWLFAGMAEDLEALRQSVEVLSDTLSQIQRERNNE